MRPTPVSTSTPLRTVADGVNKLTTDERGFLIITHYQRLLDYITPDRVHIFMDGRILESGGPELAEKLEEEGYESFRTVSDTSQHVTDLSHTKDDFPVLSTGVHFLDSGASSQKPIPVLEAMDQFARTSYANVHRGAYKLSVAATDAYEAARARVAEFIGSPSPDQVVFTRGTTTALNTVAFGWGLENLAEGDRILTTEMEHHANLVPWQMVAKRTGAKLDHVAITDDGRLDHSDFSAKLGSDVKVVAVTGMSNVFGHHSGRTDYRRRGTPGRSTRRRRCSTAGASSPSERG